ncbi:MAG: hypothetical protein RIR12_954 [Bacteroidota bacterium]|jgi:hypothetical protein
MQKILLSGFLCLAFASLHAQYTVSGVVKDMLTNEPLGGASVFCQNTTLGTTCNKQGEFTLSIKPGGYDLIFSYTGYATQTIRVSEGKMMEVAMVKEDKSIGEVVIKNSYEVADGLEKYGDFFKQHFIGTTPNALTCELLNPQVLKFFYYKKSNRLKVLATAPLQIANHALGYQLRYQLDSFVYWYSSNINTYRGYCLYTEMEASDSLKKIWAVNRAHAYRGSKLQFMRSVYDSTIVEDGWIIDMLDEKNDSKFNKIPNVYDSSYYNIAMLYPEKTITVAPVLPDTIPTQQIVLDSANGVMQVEFYFPRKISVTYTKKAPEKEYLKKMNLPLSVPYIISYIDVKDWIAVTENGYYYEQKDWVNQGYWSWKNVGDLLPYDYLPN